MVMNILTKMSGIFEVCDNQNLINIFNWKSVKCYVMDVIAYKNYVNKVMWL